jgi:alpha-beta hydrolase superfamily lysophospholipase
MTSWTKILLAVGAAAGGAIIATTPPDLSYIPRTNANPDLEALLHEPQDNLVPGTEKQLTWFDGEHATQWSVVALHGFSASRQETAPLAATVATRLGANLFETRFAGHGQERNRLVDVTAEEWLDDVADALTVGRLIGKKIVVIAASNGAALALSMLDHPTMQAVDSLIMLSPNFGPADPKAMWITRPGGPILLRLVSGKTRSWDAHNELQERYWTTSYPTRTLVEVIRVVDRALNKIETATAPRVQVFYSPDDRVLSVPDLLSGYASIQSPLKALVMIEQTGSPSAHIIAGDIISPGNTARIADDINRFILHRAPEGGPELVPHR